MSIKAMSTRRAMGEVSNHTLPVMIAAALICLPATAGQGMPPVRKSETSVDPLISSSISAKEWQDRSALRLATCETNERRGDVLSFVSVMPESSGWIPAASRLHVEFGCLGMWNSVTQRYDPLLFREAFYQALYRDDFGRGQALPVSQVAPLNFASEFSPAQAAMPPVIQSLRAFGDCVARRDPVGVHRLLLTEYGSKDQQTALSALGQPLSYCLSPGSELHFGALMLRGTLAEGLYKLSKAYASLNLVQHP